MSASGDIIRRLLGSGMSGQAIGEAVGRDRSLVSQVGRGIKPGANLEAALTALEARELGQVAAPVPAPPRRTTRTGRLAGVRRPTTIRGRSYSTATIKKQAAGGGGRALMHTVNEAADDGRSLSATISFDKSVTVVNSSPRRTVAGATARGRGKTGRGGSVEMQLDMPPEEVADTITYDYGGNVAAFLLAEAEARGYISGSADAGAHIAAIELRSY